MLLYITRKFPPSVGGMQRFNFKLVNNLKPLTDFSLISWGGSQILLPFFLLYAFLKALFLCLVKPIDCIYVSDGLLSPLGYILKLITRKPVIANIHGRDIAFDLKLYQLIVPWCLRRMDKVICVSSQLKLEVLKRGIREEKVRVIPNGVDVKDFDVATDTNKFSDIIQQPSLDLSNKKILITVGRLVAKKGVDSFVSNIFPLVLNSYPDCLYLIAGDGPLREKIEGLIKKHDLQKNVILLGQVSMDGGLLPELYKTADIFIMPNVPVEDDMEGFGIVALEAGASGLPVIASDVDGISQAVKNNENGLLVKYDHYDEFAQSILTFLNNDKYRSEFGKKAKEYVRTHYAWESIAKQYMDEFDIRKEEKSRV